MTPRRGDGEARLQPLARGRVERGPIVVVHGDPHPANTLRAPDGRGRGWVLVDPDGFRADPAYDAGGSCATGAATSGGRTRDPS